MCLFPIKMMVSTKHYGKYQMKVPCGKCLECYKEQQDQWTTRIYQELLSCSGKAIFVTLTYNEKAVPRVKHEGKDLLSLQKKDVQDWIKRYRTRYYRENGKNPKFKYFLCGEYGSVTHRPHYHMIIFDFTPKDFIPLKADWESTYGFTQIQAIRLPKNETSRSFYNVAAYVGKYSVKGLFDNPNAQNIKQKVDGKEYTIKNSSIINRSFRQCSKGIGIGYINDKTIAYHLAYDLPEETPEEVWLEEVCKRRQLKICGDKSTLHLRLPKYYANKIYGEGTELSNKITDFIWHFHNDIRCEELMQLQTQEQVFAYFDTMDLQESTKSKFKTKELYRKQKEFFVTNSQL